MDASLTSAIPPKTEAFLRESVSKGTFPSLKELKKFARKKGEKVSTEDLANYAQFYVRVAKLSSKKPRPNRWASLGISHYGLVFVDLAYMYQRYKAFNGNHVGFVLGVEAMCHKLAVIPIKNKTKLEWKRAIHEMVDASVFDRVTTLASDQEPAILSRHFRKQLEAEKGVSVVFLTRKNKSFLAETYIHHVKKAIAKATEMRRMESDPDYRNWISLLPAIVKTFNNRYARGTSFKRKDVNASNFHDFLGEMLKTEDPTLLMHTRSIDADRLASRKWIARLFRFDLGQKVLVHRKAIGKTSELFTKPSERGSFSPSPKVIHKRVLKRTADSKFLIPG